MRAGIRRRDLFASPSLRYADPRIGLLAGSAWEAARPSICRTLGLSTDAPAEVARLAERLEAAYRGTAANLPKNAAVHVDGAELVLSALDKLEEPPSLVALKAAVAARLPRVDLPELLAAHPRAEIGGSALDHAPGIGPVHRLLGQGAGAAGGGAEEGGLAAVTDACRLYVGVEVGFQGGMCRHFMPLDAFLTQPDPPAFAVGVVVFDAHGDDSADAGEGEGHHANQRAVAQPDHGRGVDAVQQLACLFGIQHRGLARLDDMRGPRTACAGLVATTWQVTSQSNSMRMAARCCLTVGFSKWRSSDPMASAPWRTLG